MDKNIAASFPENTASKSEDVQDFESAFELTGHGRFSHAVLLVGGLALLGVIMESLGAGFLLPAAHCDLALSVPEKGVLSSAVFIGIVCSSHLWGYLGDTLGRRKVMVPGLLLGAVTSMLSSLAPAPWLLITARILVGFFISSAAATVYAYVGEFHTDSWRAKGIARVSWFISLALISLPVLGWLIIPHAWRLPLPLLGISYSPWRLYIAVCSLPNLLAALLLLRLPESPKFLHASGRTQEALLVIRSMYASNHAKAETDCPIKGIQDAPLADASESVLSSMWKQTVPLFKMPLLTCNIMACFNQFTVFFMSSGLYLWFPELLTNILHDFAQSGDTVCDVFKKSKDFAKTLNQTDLAEPTCEGTVSILVFQIGVAMGGIFCLCYLIIGIIIDVVGKKTLLFLFMTMSSLCTLGLYWAHNPYLIISLWVLLLCCGCLGGVVTSVAVDLFPTKLRVMAVSLSLMCGRLGAIVGANLAGLLLANSCHNTFIVFGLVAIVCACTAALWPKHEDVKRKLEKKGTPFT